MKETNSIDSIRQQIDDIDQQLLYLLNERMELVKRIGELKQSSNTAIYRPEREKAILDRLNQVSEGRLTTQAIEAIFLEIFAVSRNIELPEKVAYLGPEGSFTHQAAEARFGAMSDYIPLKNIQSVFDAVVTHRTRFGIIPVENNQEGIVNETINLLSENDIQIVAEIPMPIHLAFASQEERLSNVKKVYSKDIAFRQCSNFIEDYLSSEVELIPVDSTSTAARLAAAERGTASVCAHIAAKMYDLPVLFENIEDSSDNYTRFLIISQNFKNDRSGNDKTTVLAKISAEPGSLATFLQEFYEANINLVKIESYPAKKGKNFSYWFLLEFEGHVDDPNVVKVMQKNEPIIKWLGSYPKLC